MARLSRYFEFIRIDSGTQALRVHLEGAPLLRLALTNKGTAFTNEERIALGIEGLLPPNVTTMEQQIDRTYAAYKRESTPLAKYVNLRNLQERNEILFYALLARHIEEMLPIIYTPTVAEAVKNFSSIYQNARGLSISPHNVSRAEQMANNCLLDDVRMIVATDSSAILGIGDQGWGGMAIAIGKLALYTVAGGVSPYRTLPVGLDVGTDRKDLQESSSYLGARQPRLKGDEYLKFLDRFVDSVAKRWPRAVVQWEDLSKDTAFAVLERYRKRIPSFNDDIQGTGAVALAGLIAASKIRGRKLEQERIVVYGAGAGGAGVAWAIDQGLLHTGLSHEQVRERLFVIDSKGLLVEGRAMEDYKRRFAQPRNVVADWKSTDLLGTIQSTKATVLLGLSGQPGTFTEPMVRAMAEHCEQPVVFPLSNPTSACEATPADILAWSNGRAMVATGSPFEPVNGKAIGQGNNAFIFPGLGFGAILAFASEITDSMVLEAAYALADRVPPGKVYPNVSDLTDVSIAVATRVVRKAFAEGVARTKKTNPEDAERYVRAKFWQPKYCPFLRG